MKMTHLLTKFQRPKQKSQETETPFYNKPIKPIVPKKIFIFSNKSKNLVEQKLELALIDLFKSDIAKEQQITITKNINIADVIVFMLSENMSDHYTDVLKAVNKNVIKIGFLTSGSKVTCDLNDISNLIIVTQKTHDVNPKKMLSQVLKLPPTSYKLKRLPISSLIKTDQAVIGKVVKLKSHHTAYYSYLKHIGFYDIMANALTNDYMELIVNCETAEQAEDLYNSLIYAKDVAQQFQNKCIIKSTIQSEDLLDELKTIREHAFIKVIRLIKDY